MLKTAVPYTPDTTDDAKNCWGQNAVLMAARFSRPSVKILNPKMQISA